MVIRPDIKTVLADNLRRLMQHSKGKAQKQLGLHALSGVAQATIGRILRAETTATIEVVDALAKVFDLQAWQLLVPGLNPTNPQIIPALDPRETALYERIRVAMEELAEYRVQRDTD